MALVRKWREMILNKILSHNKNNNIRLSSHGNSMIKILLILTSYILHTEVRVIFRKPTPDMPTSLLENFGKLPSSSRLKSRFHDLGWLRLQVHTSPSGLCTWSFNIQNMLNLPYVMVYMHPHSLSLSFSHLHLSFCPHKNIESMRAGTCSVCYCCVSKGARHILSILAIREHVEEGLVLSLPRCETLDKPLPSLDSRLPSAKRTQFGSHPTTASNDLKSLWPNSRELNPNPRTIWLDRRNSQDNWALVLFCPWFGRKVGVISLPPLGIRFSMHELRRPDEMHCQFTSFIHPEIHPHVFVKPLQYARAWEGTQSTADMIPASTLLSFPLGGLHGTGEGCRRITGASHTVTPGSSVALRGCG